MDKMFHSTFNYRLIYIFAMPDERYRGLLKIGKASIETDLQPEQLHDNSSVLNKAAHARIKQYTNTIAAEYQLLHTELALRTNEKGVVEAFNDTHVHNCLRSSGIEKHCFEGKTANEWYECDLETAINAIKAVKENRISLKGYEISHDHSPIIFREEQRKAIDFAMERFAAGSHAVLWNAKMRFGKTLSALQLVKEEGFERTLIFTHRPGVNEGWYKDFLKIFYESDTEYDYGSKKNNSIEKMVRSGQKFVYFASIQDLRGSEEVGGKFNKNDIIFKTEWDLVIIDEAHEGTQTEKGQRVIDAFKKSPTYFLHLSGTPFNILEKKEFSD